MFFAKQIDNNIYIVFQDTSIESKDLFQYIQKELPALGKKTFGKIKDFLEKNSVIDDNARRQKTYISHLKTYIDIVDEKTPLSLHIHVIPKDFEIIYQDTDENTEKNIDFFQQFSFDVFKSYAQLTDENQKDFEIYKASKGRTFLEYEFDFYLKKLNTLYDYLLNYKRTLKDMIIVSDKKIGIEIDDLNRLESDKLKTYQFVKTSHQSDLIIFIFSLIEYLKDKRLFIFASHRENQKLLKTIAKIDNFLKKISSSKHIKKESINSKNLKSFFARYKNSKEIQKNQSIYQILEDIFYSQLEKDSFIFKTIDMTKMFEEVVKIRLKHTYGEEFVNIGDESKKTFIGNDKTELENRKYLLDQNTLPQYPDFIIKEDEIFHIVDAKYKTKNSLYKDSNAFRQVIVYAKLFNKRADQTTIMKLLIYAQKKRIDIDTYAGLETDLEVLPLSSDMHQEQLFDGTVSVKGISVFR
jgi:hypothetical protein